MIGEFKATWNGCLCWYLAIIADIGLPTMDDGHRFRAELRGFGHIAPRPGWQMGWHVHNNSNELICVVGGVIEVEIAGKTFCGQRGDLLYYPQGQWHIEKSVGDEAVELLFLSWQWTNNETGDGWPLLTSDHTGRMQMLFGWMRELFPPARPDEAHMLNVLLEALLFELERSFQTGDRAMVRRVKSFMQNHLAAPLTLEMLAEAAGLSKFHFCREFKKATGTTPMNFLRQVRVEAARSLLLSTPWPLKAIAPQVGFADEFQLSRIFRRVTGMSPKQIRKN